MPYIVTTVRLPREMLNEIDEIADKLGKDRSAVLREALREGLRELKIRMALDLYRRGLISFSRVSEITGLGYWEILEEAKRRGVILRYCEEEFS